VYYAVVDTNILVSAALAKDHLQSVPYAVFQGVSKHLFTPIVDENIVEEYYDVMSRSKFHWNVSYGRRFVDEILKYAINEPVVPTDFVLPDTDDRIFYDVAFAHRDKNAYIVTGNIKHFPNVPFVISVRDFLDLINPVQTQMVVNENVACYSSSALMSALRTHNEEALKNDSAGMSEEEIEAEVKAARAERR
jgi:predicted nucleic acid-binding protein